MLKDIGFSGFSAYRFVPVLGCRESHILLVKPPSTSVFKA